MEDVSNVDLEGKSLVLRTDLNLPVENGDLRKTVKFERYMDTIRQLSEAGARTLVVAHQGRPARKDFVSLEDHAELVSEELDQDVEFVRSFFGTQLGDAVASMEDGDVAMLENVRFLSEELQNLKPEMHSRDYFVKNLAKYFDLFVNDAFSAAHRSHGSTVGFMPLIDTYAGPVMEKELRSCGKVRDEVESPVLVLGGEKPADLIGMMEQMIERAEKVLLAGIPGELALAMQGHQLGEKSEWIEEQGFDSRKEELQQLLDQHGEKIILPDDLKTDSGNYKPEKVPADEMTWDIGRETQQKFIDEIRNADSVVMKGPMGAFEDYPEGTREIVDEIASCDAYTVLGGGHTSSLVHRFGHDLDEFSHVSIAGGAFVRYMSGEELAVVRALEKYS